MTRNIKINSLCHKKIHSFYGNVGRKYRNTYSQELMRKNINDAFANIYKIENGLLRRKPPHPKWNGLFMATAGKWNYFYRIGEDGTIYV